MVNFEAFSDPSNKPELSLNTFRDVLEMLEETVEDDESLANMLQEMIEEEPTPDPSDEEAARIYKEKMRLIEARANEILARSDVLLNLRQRIDGKIQEITRE